MLRGDVLHRALHAHLRSSFVAVRSVVPDMWPGSRKDQSSILTAEPTPRFRSPDRIGPEISRRHCPFGRMLFVPFMSGPDGATSHTGDGHAAVRSAALHRGPRLDRGAARRTDQA